MERPNILIFMTDHQRADTVLPEHPARTPLDDPLVEVVVSTARQVYGVEPVVSFPLFGLEYMRRLKAYSRASNIR